MRRCGWIPTDTVAPAHLVWVRNDVALETCPKSYITPESQSLVDEFFAWRRFGAFDGGELSARQVEAFVILEKELGGEMNDGRHDARQAT